MSKRKLLINEVFRRAKEESQRDTKNGLASYLWLYFKDDIGFEINDKSFSRYYDTYVTGNGEIKIQQDRLDKLSQYIGYKNFTDFSRTFIKTEEDANKTTVKISVDENDTSLTDKIINIIITNEQFFKMPEFMKKNGMGIMEIVLLLCFTTGTIAFSKNPINKTQGFAGILESQPKCMYWDKVEYKPADCEDDRPNLNLKPADDYLVKYFKKITRKDTLTVENAVGNTWYSKYNGVVEFFTLDGEDPDNGRELRSSTAYIVEKYAGIQEE
jgi:tRNA U38,U39,U40 pseudouridine synthase TruA